MDKNLRNDNLNLVKQFETNNKLIRDKFKNTINEIDEEMTEIWTKIIKEKDLSLLDDSVNNMVKDYEYMLLNRKTHLVVCIVEKEVYYARKLNIEFKETDDDLYIKFFYTLDSNFEEDTDDRVNNRKMREIIKNRKEILRISHKIYDNFEEHYQDKLIEANQNYKKWILNQEKILLDLE